MITKIEGQCQYEGCDKPATHIASGRATRMGPEWYENQGHPTLALYCEAHGEKVADEGAPEYHTTCPNCGCYFGVN